MGSRQLRMYVCLYLYVQSHLEIGILKNKKIKNLQIGKPRKPCKNIETSPSHRETLSKNSLSFCQEDEPASDEFCSIIRLSIQFILDELSVLGRQLISSINSDVKVTFNCITGRCLWLLTIRNLVPRVSHLNAWPQALR